MNYRSSGVNIAEAEKLVHWLKKKKSPLFSSQVVASIGGYSGIFKAFFSDIKEPCLSAGVDGVGTKLKLATHFQSYKEVGQDLVAMCVNDILCCGAKPLFFMDYYACGKIRQKSAREFLSGVQKACEQSQCLLLGGETAEMPDCYQGKNFDCAGFALGVVDRKKILGAHKVKIGDKLVGVQSTGFHSNGFSLLRKVFKKDLHKWKKELLKPTALYAPLALKLFKIKGLKAMAHITGGGMDNLLRVLPKNTKAEITPWEMPLPFKEVQKRTKLSTQEMLKTFNCGVGLVLVVSPSTVKSIKPIIKNQGFSFMELGKTTAQKTQKPSWQWSK